MATWHQKNAGLPRLYHPTQWSSYNPRGHLSVMRHESRESCMEYCARTGDIPLAPAAPHSDKKGARA